MHKLWPIYKQGEKEQGGLFSCVLSPNQVCCEPTQAASTQSPQQNLSAAEHDLLGVCTGSHRLFPHLVCGQECEMDTCHPGTATFPASLGEVYETATGNSRNEWGPSGQPLRGGRSPGPGGSRQATWKEKQTLLREATGFCITN